MVRSRHQDKAVKLDISRFSLNDETYRDTLVVEPTDHEMTDQSLNTTGFRLSGHSSIPSTASRPDTLMASPDWSGYDTRATPVMQTATGAIDNRPQV
jgi:hypothetical protein